MKGLLIATLASVASLAVMAGEVTPVEWDYVWAQRVSPNGRYVMGQDMGSCYVKDMETGRDEVYPEMYPGDSNCISDNGILVGEDISLSKAVIMQNDKVYHPGALDIYYVSCFEGVTPDGTIAVGYAMQGSTQYPIVYDIADDSMMILPFPEKDENGEETQGAACHAVSDDGCTIAGILVNGDGFTYTPIVFTRNEAGEWEYSMPDMTPFGTNYIFGGYMSLSPDGKMMTVARMDVDPQNPYVDVIVPYLYNLTTGEFGPIESTVDNLLPTQVLADGSVIAVSSPSAFIPYRAFIKLPGADDFVLFTDMLQEKFPEYYSWIDETLGMEGIIGYDEDGIAIIGRYIVTGTVAVSNDYVTVAGGLPEGDFFSYIFYNPDLESGVERIEPSLPASDIYYDLQGLPVAHPEPGRIYIHNGKLVKN